MGLTLVLSVLFAVVGALVGLLISLAAVEIPLIAGPSAQKKSIVFTGSCLLVFCLWFTHFLYINDVVEVLYAAPVAFIVFILFTFNATASTRRDIAVRISLARKLEADENALFTGLDADEDGVISYNDLNTAGPKVVGNGLTTQEMHSFKANLRDIGHCVQTSLNAYVVSRADLYNLVNRTQERYKAWLS